MRMMTSSTREVGGVTVVELSGRITLGEGSVLLRELVRDLLNKGNKDIVLNLGDVIYIDSSGLGELVSAYATARNSGGDLKLVNLNKNIQNVFQITKLHTIFDVQDEAAAVASTGK